ncbi:MAG: hypothetical protein V1688_05165 [bacterium]
MLDYYKEIYLWPWIKISPFLVRKIKYWRRIWWIDERMNLKRSDWKILYDEVRQSVKGVCVLGVREEQYTYSPNVYTILLKLPKRASKILQEEAGADNLRICLKPYRYSMEGKQSKTKKVVAEIHHHPNIIYKEANFCGPEWRQNFISFLQKIAA